MIVIDRKIGRFTVEEYSNLLKGNKYYKEKLIKQFKTMFDNDKRYRFPKKYKTYIEANNQYVSVIVLMGRR